MLIWLGLDHILENDYLKFILKLLYLYIYKFKKK